MFGQVYGVLPHRGRVGTDNGSKIESRNDPFLMMLVHYVLIFG